MKTIKHKRSDTLHGLGIILIVVGIITTVIGFVLFKSEIIDSPASVSLGLCGIFTGILFLIFYPIIRAAETYLAKEGDKEFYEEIEDPNHNTEQ